MELAVARRYRKVLERKFSFRFSRIISLNISFSFKFGTHYKEIESKMQMIFLRMAKI
jgi:hypothetical protein